MTNYILEKHPQDVPELAGSDLLDRAVQMLEKRGPMKAKKLADALKLPNARSLSMQLQWAPDRARCDGGKWKAVPSHDEQAIAKLSEGPAPCSETFV